MKLFISFLLLGLVDHLRTLVLPGQDLSKSAYFNDGDMSTYLSYAVDDDTGTDLFTPSYRTMEGNDTHQFLKRLREAGPEIEEIKKRKVDRSDHSKPISEYETTIPFVQTSGPNDYCGDTVSWTVGDDSGPDGTDCLSLQTQVDQSWDYFDWPGNSEELDEYHPLASYGTVTCGNFTMPWNTNISILIGNTDVRNPLSNAAPSYPSQAVYSIFSCTPSGTTTSWAIMVVTP